MKILIRIDFGETIVIDVSADDSVENIKRNIHAATQILPKYQKLAFCGAVLDDESLVSELNIQPESTLMLSVRIDSGYTVSQKFVGLTSITAIFEEAQNVKALNDELHAAISGVSEVNKFHYHGEYSLNEEKLPVFNIVEECEVVSASSILGDFEMDGELHAVKDYFNDKIDFSVASFGDLMRLNEEMMGTLVKFVELLEDGTSERMVKVVSEYAENYCALYRNFSRVAHVELVDDKSRLEALNAHQAVITAQFDHLANKGVQFQKPTPPVPLFPDSTIMPADRRLERDTFNEWLNMRGNEKPFELLYRSSVHGKQSQQFHARCDNKGPTVTVIRCSQGNIFGGYNSNSWQSGNGSYASSSTSFLFSLVNPRHSPPKKYDIDPSKAGDSTYNYSSQGPFFGGSDMKVDNGHTNSSYCNFPYTYRDPDGYGNATFTGAYNFTPAEVEVWRVPS